MFLAEANRAASSSLACASAIVRVCHAAVVSSRGQIAEMVSFHMRLPKVGDIVMPTRWESDFVKGAGNVSSVDLLVEHISQLVLLANMENATTALALAGFTAKLNGMSAPLR
jgi:IS30 family transposase